MSALLFDDYLFTRYDVTHLKEQTLSAKTVFFANSTRAIGRVLVDLSLR